MRELLEARNQLANLLTYMDGKSGAEQLMAQLLEDPVLMASLLAQSNPPTDAAVDV
nr:type VI secretion system contractile sheath small subunit [Pseudomonas carnis]